MSPTQFMDLRAGQRLLILQKCQDLVKSTDRRLAIARDEFLEKLVQLGIQLDELEYRKIVSPAIEHGFGAIGDRDGHYAHGIRAIRYALMAAAARVTVPNHHAIVEELLKWTGSINLERQKGGLYHSLRLLVSTLMANTECDNDDAPKLADLLRRVNELQGTRPSESDSDLEYESENEDSPLTL